MCGCVCVLVCGRVFVGACVWLSARMCALYIYIYMCFPLSSLGGDVLVRPCVCEFVCGVVCGWVCMLVCRFCACVLCAFVRVCVFVCVFVCVCV